MGKKKKKTGKQVKKILTRSGRLIDPDKLTGEQLGVGVESSDEALIKRLMTGKR